MHDLQSDLLRFGGLATRTQLRRMGHSHPAMRAAVRSEAVLSPARSWLATSDAAPAAMRAVALHGVLGGESALRSHGIWVTHDRGLCVASLNTASRLPAPAVGEYRIWRAALALDGERRWRAGLQDALAQALPRMTDPFAVVATLDSVLHSRRLSSHRLEALFERQPRRIRRLLRYLDARAESGLETILRLGAIKRGWRVDLQVWIDGVGRVDLLIDGWLVIEADGAMWHDSAESASRDRYRNAALVQRGYRWHRFGYAQIVHDLDGCLAVIALLLAHGRPATS